jgi:multiple sugar transport system ATP-binding protein
MNLVSCQLQAGGADLGGGTLIALPADLRERAAAAPGHVFGIRPENLSLAPRHVPGEVAVQARVVISEPLGAETLVTFQVGNVELIARCSASFRAPAGTPQNLYLDPAAMHLFSQASGQAI